MSMASETLGKEFQYYLDNQDSLVSKYEGRYIVIKNQMVIGDYDTEIEAFEASILENEVGTFLIQFAFRGDETHTQIFHSRVSA